MTRKNIPIEVHGHRGARGHYPENTLSAFRYAVESGVDVLEMDLAVTLDGILVVSHDPHINPLICLAPGGKKENFPPLIHSLTLKQLKEYDCGTLRHPGFSQQRSVPGETFPTLQEVFDWVQFCQEEDPNPQVRAHAAKVGFNIETKIFPQFPEYTVDPQEFAQKVTHSFRNSGFGNRLLLQSFDPRTLKEARKLNPGQRISLLIEDPETSMLQRAQEIQANVVSPDFQLLTKDGVGDLQKAGCRVVPWTLNTSQEWIQAVAMEVDGIITDYPKELIEFLRAHFIL